jgi:protein TonB
MTYPSRLLIFAAVSAAAHLLLAHGMAHLPRQAKAQQPALVQIELRNPPTAPPEPEEQVQPKRPSGREAPSRRMLSPRALAARPERPPRELPPTERVSVTSDTTLTPTFGISMESVSEGPAGPAMPIGNTLQIKPTKAATTPSMVKPLAAPVEAYEVTKMPLPTGRCSGEYTEEARRAGAEGTVVLDLVVGADGTARDITVTQGLGHGLTEAAVAALKRCRFTPGERGGKPVPVRVRGFKIRFFLQEER